jgi:magnesium-transporting ATPase (P-type)
MDTEAAGKQRGWESAPGGEVLTALESRRDGLDEAEAGRRLERHGRNELPPPARRSSLVRFVDQFRSVLIYVLLGAALVTAIIGHWIDMAVIVAVVIANAVMGWFQEGRAEQALAAVGRLLAATAVAVRGGTRRVLPAAELVPGDIVFVESGDRVPADLRLVETHSLSIDEALLTGESVPVAKAAEPVAPDLPLADRASMAFSGTTVAAGQAIGVVVATGSDTELGKIGHLVESVENLDTPLLERLSRTARVLTLVILAFAAVTFAVGWLIGELAVEELFLAAIALAVSAIPEGLPAIMTIILAFGVRRMAAKGALIRRLPAVETLGSVTVICTDKTGTLTRNELVARKVLTPDHAYSVDGDGYVPNGAINDERGGSADAGHSPELAAILRDAVLCNDARLVEEGGDWTVAGDPVEGALIALGAKAGVDKEAADREAPRVGTLPFEADHRYMATLHGADGGNDVYVKGAPERVLGLCTTERTETGDRALDADAWHARAEAMAAEGLRVLGFATAKARAGDAFDRQAVEHDLVFLGLVGFIDPPRPEAVEAVADCLAAGIAVKMITGDHAATALAIGAEVGLDVSGGALSGADLAALEEADLAAAALRVNVFARVDPAQKLRLVEALQASGHSVAMTGDGVNDAPALRRAEIGVAMGRKGSDAARQAAGMVLVDDNFATIAHAVREGRTVDLNLRKTLAYILPTNAGESLLLIGAILIGATLPISALQVIWINFVTETTLSLSLAFEPQPHGVMRRKPRPRGAGLISRYGYFRIAFVGVVMAAVAAGLFMFGLANDRSVEAARALAVNAVVAGEVAYLLVVATIGLPWRRAGRASNRVVPIMIAAVIGLQFLATQWVPFSEALGMAPLGVLDWGLVVGAGIVIYIAAEAERRISRRSL